MSVVEPSQAKRRWRQKTPGEVVDLMILRDVRVVKETQKTNKMDKEKRQVILEEGTKCNK